MKKIKNLNGYAIYQAGPRDVKKYGFSDGSFYVYFASDVRDFGQPNSTPEFEDCGSLTEAEANCTGNFAVAKEIVEERTTAASMEEILEAEAMLDAGADPESLNDRELLTGKMFLTEERRDKITDRVAQVINRKIQKYGVTLAFLSSQVRTSAGLLRKSLDGKRSLMADEFVNLCQALDLTLEDFQTPERISE